MFSKATSVFNSVRGVISEEVSSSVKSVRAVAEESFSKTERKEGNDDELVEECEFILTVPWDDIPVDDVDLRDEIQQDILNLSSSTRHFLHCPPDQQEDDQETISQPFVFDNDNYESLANVCLKKNTELSEIRYYLVPRKIREPKFWRNYFYQIYLIKRKHGIPPNSFPLRSKVGVTPIDDINIDDFSDLGDDKSEDEHFNAEEWEEELKKELRKEGLENIIDDV